MRKLLIAALIVWLPMTGVAQDNTNTQPPGTAYSLGNVLLISAGVVAGVFIVDYLASGVLVVPTVAGGALSPAVQEASAAGAVFGDQVAAGTATMDAKARIDALYGLLVGSGAVLGGLVFDQIGSWTLTSSAPAQSK